MYRNPADVAAAAEAVARTAVRGHRSWAPPFIAAFLRKATAAGAKLCGNFAVTARVTPSINASENTAVQFEVMLEGDMDDAWALGRSIAMEFAELSTGIPFPNSRYSGCEVHNGMVSVFVEPPWTIGKIRPVTPRTLLQGNPATIVVDGASDSESESVPVTIVGDDILLALCFHTLSQIEKVDEWETTIDAVLAMIGNDPAKGGGDSDDDEREVNVAFRDENNSWTNRLVLGMSLDSNIDATLIGGSAFSGTRPHFAVTHASTGEFIATVRALADKLGGRIYIQSKANPFPGISETAYVVYNTEGDSRVPLFDISIIPFFPFARYQDVAKYATSPELLPDRVATAPLFLMYRYIKIWEFHMLHEIGALHNDAYRDRIREVEREIALGLRIFRRALTDEATWDIHFPTSRARYCGRWVNPSVQERRITMRKRGANDQRKFWACPQKREQAATNSEITGGNTSDCVFCGGGEHHNATICEGCGWRHSICSDCEGLSSRGLAVKSHCLSCDMVLVS